jgi:hypothetical protein
VVTLNEHTVTPDDFAAAYAGAIDFMPLYEKTVEHIGCDHRQAQLRTLLAETLYGQIPSAPDNIRVSREPMACEQAERLQIEITLGERRFNVDAALWLPPNVDGPVPLICGLDFIGPVGIMSSSEFPIDPHARVSSRPVYGASDYRLEETLRGVSAYRWPISLLLDAGYAVLVSCYGSWVPDDVNDWKTHGVYPLLDCQDESPTGAISLWAWSIQRLLDAAATCNEIDVSRVSVAGHSRLGKAALWAAANDSRIGAVFANNSGCGGAAPAAHPVGETFSQMHERFPHWTIPRPQGSAPKLPFDQHHLLSLIAPRAIYLAAAKDDLWADPIGSYLALKEAAQCLNPELSKDSDWPSPKEIWQSCGQVQNGPLGYHLRPGGHNILPYDWRQFLEFLSALAKQ